MNMNMNMNQVDIVIVNWNTGALLTNCLNSILKSEKECIGSVIIVDNNSSDDSCPKSLNHDMVKIIHSKQNLGFGKACNLGANYSRCPYILFLNPDTVIENNSIKSALDFMNLKTSINYAICGIQLYDDQENVSYSCSRFPTIFNKFFDISGISKLFPSLGRPMKEFLHKKTKEVDQIMGAFFLTRRNLFIESDGFDERFFIYYEEVDLSQRLSLKGYKSIFFSDVKAYHLGGGSSEQVKARRIFHSLRSEILYFRKHANFMAFILNFSIVLLFEPIMRILRTFLKLSFRDFFNTVYAYAMIWDWLIGTNFITKEVSQKTFLV